MNLLRKQGAKFEEHGSLSTLPSGISCISRKVTSWSQSEPFAVTHALSDASSTYTLTHVHTRARASARTVPHACVIIASPSRRFLQLSSHSRVCTKHGSYGDDNNRRGWLKRVERRVARNKSTESRFLGRGI